MGKTERCVLLVVAAPSSPGQVGVFHAGVEYGFWEGITSCATSGSGPVTLDSIMNAPLVRCDAGARSKTLCCTSATVIVPLAGMEKTPIIASGGKP